MALGALIGANGESGDGRHALVALGGRPLIDLQVRSLHAHGAAPIVVYPELPHPAIEAAVAALKAEGLPVVLAMDAREAASRFGPEDRCIVLGDGIVPAPEHIAALAALDHAALIALPDTAAHEAFERIDLEWRWAGMALSGGEGLRSTAAMVGDWDLVSTLVRRMIQARCAMVPVAGIGPVPLKVLRTKDAQPYEDRLAEAAQGDRRDWLSRYVLFPLEERLSQWASGQAVRPSAWQFGGLALLVLSAAAMAFGPWWSILPPALLALFPDLVARQVARRRLQSEDPRFKRWRRIGFWSVVAALGWRCLPVLDWVAPAAAAIAILFLSSADLEARRRPLSERLSLWSLHWRPTLLFTAIGASFAPPAILLALTAVAGLNVLLLHRRGERLNFP